MTLINKAIISYLKDDHKKEILENYMISYQLNNFYSSLKNTKTQNCLMETEMLFPSVVTSMYIAERGLKKSQEDKKIVSTGGPRFTRILFMRIHLTRALKILR